MSVQNRWLPLARVQSLCAVLGLCEVLGLCAVLAGSVAAGSALAQPGPRADPSPLAPGDLKRPIFDTQTPVYDTAAKQARSASTVVAEVDGRAVTLGDVGDAIRALPSNVANLPFADLYPDIVTQLIRQQALVIRAQRQALDEDPAVRRKMKAASDQVLANEMLTQEASGSITEATLLERYNNEIDGKPGPDEVHVRVIMVPTEQEAIGIIGQLRGGADFAAIAKRSSKDATAPVGGDAGFVPLDRLTREVGAVVFSMQPGQFTPFPVRSAGSWFVLKVDERRHQPNVAFSAMREELRQAMLREKAPAVIAAAVADVTVRAYDINGKEADASSAGGGARAVR
jgi:peptidyl-prolyl cis-trans isomerase C